MADVYDYIIETGTIVPDAEEIKTQVENEYKSVFGDDLIVTPDTPQGVLITTEVLARKAVADNNAALANQINPNLAGGIFLDAIGALTGSQRIPASKTLVTAQLTGVASTIIPQGSQARDSVNNFLFESVETVTLNGTGNATVVFQAVDYGAIEIGAHTLTQIVSEVLGWETVDNAAIAFAIGAPPQSDDSFKLLRRNTLALQGDALPYAIISGLYATTGVRSLSFQENIAATTEVINGVTMLPHSIYACVDGGSDEYVAMVLLNKKSGGCNYTNGASSNPVNQVVTVPYSGQVMTIKFDRPDEIPILVKATVKVNTALQDPIALVKKAILDYANGLIPGESGLTVGTSVSCFELAGAVNIEQPGIYVVNMQISLAPTPVWSNNPIPIEFWQIATVIESSITVDIV